VKTGKAVAMSSEKKKGAPRLIKDYQIEIYTTALGTFECGRMIEKR